MNKSKQKRAGEATVKTAILSAFYGLAISGIAFVILTLVLALISLLCNDPGAVARISGYVVLYISALVGGLFSYKRCGGYPLICGLSFGCIYALINLILSFIPVVSVCPLSLGIAWAMRALAIAVAVLGSFIGTYKPKRKHKARRRR